MTQPRTPIWKAIAQSIRHDVASGHYSAGDKLPTEAEFAARFGVNRHTVRRAHKALIDEGLVHARRGSGVFVAMTPTEYPIGRRVRFHQNLAAAGRSPAKDILHLSTRGGDARECAALGLAEGSKVHAYEGLSLADGLPIALFRSVFPAEGFEGLPEAIRESHSVTRALEVCGVADYTRASTRLTAVLADATQALHLRLSEGAPLLRTRSINVDPAGKPVEYGHTWFAGDRVTLSVDSL
ncbi:MAG: phosphonate metabolism transcriptional regulator PhnF [Sulfitobacter sp.]